MNLTRLALVIGTLALLFGCAADDLPARPKICPLHHVKLVTKTVYYPPAGTCVVSLPPPPKGWLEAEERFPCATPIGARDERSELDSVKARVRYCPQCDIGLAEAQSALPTPVTKKPKT